MTRSVGESLEAARLTDAAARPLLATIPTGCWRTWVWTATRSPRDPTPGPACDFPHPVAGLGACKAGPGAR